MKAKVVRDHEKRFEAEARRANLLPVQCAEARCHRKAAPGFSRCGVHTRGWVGAGRDYGSAWPRIRASVLAREPDCRICGRSAVTVDHIVPKARGGTDDESNLRPLCRVHAAEKDLNDRVTGQKIARARRGGDR